MRIAVLDHLPVWVRIALRGAALLPVLAVPIGCTTTVVTPAAVKRPVTVYLLDHGRTPSLVLPADSGKMVRYMYGDWEWYARSNTNAWRGFLALFVPTQGTLGRDAFPAVDSAGAVREAVAVGIDELFAIEVERGRAWELHQALESQFAAKRDESVWSEGNRARFVPHPQKYTYFTNSNHMVAGWLRELGCETRGPAFHSRWKVESGREEAGGCR